MATPIARYADEIHNQVKHKFQRRSVESFNNNDIWAIDLVDVSNLSEDNDNVKFLLNIIDIYSRYAYSFPLKSKKSSEVLRAFKTLDTLPTHIWADQGSEFFNAEFKKFCKDNNIILYHTFSNLKSVFVERFNRTLKEMMYKYFTEHNTDYYLNQLDNFIDAYNNTIHSRTKQKPIDVYKHGKIPYTKPVSANVEASYKVGDYVRISKYKKTFEKGYTARWSKEVFKVKAVDTTRNPAMYEIEDLQGEEVRGKFYAEELQPTALKDFAIVEKIVQRKTVKGKKLYLVKYDGYDDKFNEWLTQSQLDLIT
jgi:hypothetical protein